MTTVQHAEGWPVAAPPVIVVTLPSRPTWYDDAPLGAAAFDTTIRSCFAKANPNGVLPADVNQAGAAASPSLSTTKVVIRFVAFSVTTSTSPFGLNCTCAGLVCAALSGRVEPASGRRSPSASTVRPEIEFGAPAFRT